MATAGRAPAVSLGGLGEEEGGTAAVTYPTDWAGETSPTAWTRAMCLIGSGAGTGGEG